MFKYSGLALANRKGIFLSMMDGDVLNKMVSVLAAPSSDSDEGDSLTVYFTFRFQSLK